MNLVCKPSIAQGVVCALCVQHANLCRSHIFPKFLAIRFRRDVGNHLLFTDEEDIGDLEQYQKRKGWYIHTSHNNDMAWPQWRLDMPYEHLLCKKCEGILSKMECRAGNHEQFFGKPHGRIARRVLTTSGNSQIFYHCYMDICTGTLVRFWLSILFKICASKYWNHSVLEKVKLSDLRHALSATNSYCVLEHPIALFEMPLLAHDEYHVLSWCAYTGHANGDTPEFVGFTYNRFVWIIALNSHTNLPNYFSNNQISADGNVTVNMFSDTFLPPDLFPIVTEEWYFINSLRDVDTLNNRIFAQLDGQPF